MALAKKGTIDETLEIVKDAEKFKTRIEALARAKNGADASVAKAREKLKELNAAMDEAVALAQKATADGNTRMKAADKAVADAMVPVIEAQAQATRLNSSVAKREEKLKQDTVNLAVKVAAHEKTEASFIVKVSTFQNGAASVARTAID